MVIHVFFLANSGEVVLGQEDLRVGSRNPKYPMRTSIWIGIFASDSLILLFVILYLFVLITFFLLIVSAHLFIPSDPCFLDSAYFPF